MAGNFANARIEKLIRQAGAQRVAGGAIKRMNEILTEQGLNMAKYAVEIARRKLSGA